MRALILIVSCVIVLAVLQASYLVVDAHTTGPVVRISTGEVHHRSRPHPATAQAQALKDTRDQTKMTKPPPTPVPTTTRVAVPGGGRATQDGGDLIELRQLCQRRPELSRCRTQYIVRGLSTGTGGATGGKGRADKTADKTQQITETRQEGNSAALASDGEISVNETIRQILELAINRKSKTKSTSGLSGQGAHHPNITTSTSPSSSLHSDNSDKAPNQQLNMQLPVGRQKSLADEISIPEVNIRRIHHKELGYHNYANRNIRLHRQGCSLDRDCGTGCCLESRNGRRMCRRGGLRGLGKRCTSSCMCVSGLQCWATEFSPKHKLRKGRRPWGRCRDRNNPNLGAGFFMTSSADQRTY